MFPRRQDRENYSAGQLSSRAKATLPVAGPIDSDVAGFFSLISIAAKKARPRIRAAFPILTDHYASIIPLLTRNYFEQLFLYLSPPSALIVDDYHEVPLNSCFHDMIRHAVEAIPEGSTVFLLSRHDLPSHFAELRVDERARFLGWEEVRFTFEETKQLLHSRTPKMKWTDETAIPIHVTLLRLRRMLGTMSIQYQNRFITLDRQHCWVDLFAMENAAMQAVATWTDRNQSSRKQQKAFRLTQQVVEFYQGPLIPDSSELHCIEAMRENTRSLVLRVLAAGGNALQNAGAWKKAAYIYQKEVEIDPVSEEIYRGLMFCYLRLGHKAEAVKIYNNCRISLAQKLKADPSPETERLYRSLV